MTQIETKEAERKRVIALWMIAQRELNELKAEVNQAENRVLNAKLEIGRQFQDLQGDDSTYHYVVADGVMHITFFKTGDPLIGWNIEPSAEGRKHLGLKE